MNMDPRKFPNKEFSFFCEFQVAFELQERGWQVYQPLIDRYIDLIAVKNGNYRTIQVKSSRIENTDNGYESYGLTMKPKDLFHDVRHFFIWVFLDTNSIFHYFILNVKDFIDIRYYKLPPNNRRKYPSLLMRDEWRWGTDRLHPHRFIKIEDNKKIDDWRVEGVKINEYKDKWEKFDSVINEESYNKYCFEATEICEFWRKADKEVINIWKKNNEKAEKILKNYPDIYEKAKKLLKEVAEEDEGIIDAHLIRLTQEDANRIFEETTENWEVFLPLQSTDHVLLFKPICSKCEKYWNTSLKECFYCKTKYFRVRVCENKNCGKLYAENVKPRQRCDCGGNIVKKCINCGAIEKDRKRVFVPITFCWYCGNRQNKFEFKKIYLKR